MSVIRGTATVCLLASCSALRLAPAQRLAPLARPSSNHARRCSLTACADATSTTLQTLLTTLAPWGPIRAIVVLPGASAILEASSKSAEWTLKETDMPSGKTLLTAALPDVSFELHVDTAKATKATLGTSPKTGGPIVRVLADDGSGLLTLLPSKDHADAFNAYVESTGGEVALVPS